MYCGLPRVEQLEILLLQIADSVALLVAHHDRHNHKIHASLK